MITLRADGYEVQVDPEHGGQVQKLTYCARPVLRPARSLPNRDPLAGASFPLIPYSNRIAHGQFEFRDTPHVLRLNADPEPHALHGEGWQTAWSVADQHAHRCELTYQGGDNWSWPYHATQTIEIDGTGVLFTAEIENTGESAFPVGAGFHPYFQRFSDTTLQFQADGVLAGDRLDRADPLALPENWRFETPRTLDGVDVDHCFFGWPRHARVVQPRHALSIHISTTSPTEWTTVFVPPGGDFFCFEPVSHATGAFNRLGGEDEGVAVLAPGQFFRFEMHLSAERTE